MTLASAREVFNWYRELRLVRAPTNIELQSFEAKEELVEVVYGAEALANLLRETKLDRRGDPTL